jgi:FkbM family methyltransferase
MAKSFYRKFIEVFFNSHRFNDSAAYGLYLRLAHPAYRLDQNMERKFYDQLISWAGDRLIFDIGANSGNKAAVFAKSCAHVVCVEPSPDAARVLNERFAKHANVTIVPSGVGSCSGSLPFHVFGGTDPYNTFSPKWVDSLSASSDEARLAKEVQDVIPISITTLDKLIDEYGLPSYIKIDVEGYEAEVLKGLTRGVNMISFECNLPEFEREALECLECLDEIQSGPRFNFCIYEPPTKFSLQSWVGRSEMARIITERRHGYMEIFSSVTNVPLRTQ